VHPVAAEACNGIDDDCNGEVDENVNTPDATITPGGTVAACRGTTVTLSANSSPSYSYQWYKDGMAITGATNSTYNSTGTQHGYYTVVVTGVNGCVGTSDPTHVLRKPSLQATITVAIPSNNPDLCVNGRVKLHANGAQDLTYQWYHNNMLIAGATNQNYVAMATGSYTVKILNTASGCSKFSEAVAVTNSCRLPELVTPTMNIYPNPASDKIEIQFTNGDKDEWLLIFYDLTGREILRKVCWDKEKITIPLYSFRDGLYFLQAFRNGNLFESQKVVIQKKH
jgi:hypothetical protein